jgi:hypothetical protein
MIPLDVLTLEEYNAFLKSGMLWEVYPEATGVFEKYTEKTPDSIPQVIVCGGLYVKVSRVEEDWSDTPHKTVGSLFRVNATSTAPDGEVGGYDCFDIEGRGSYSKSEERAAHSFENGCCLLQRDLDDKDFVRIA